MLKNFFKIAYRHLLRNRGFSFVNIITGFWVKGISPAIAGLQASKATITKPLQSLPVG